MATPSQQADVIDRDEVHIFSEFEDVERKAYIEVILANDPDLERILRANLFLLWFADKEILRQMSLQEGDFSLLAMGKLSEEPDRMPKQRDENPAKKTLIRDGNRCLLTKHGKPGIQVAHIVPFMMHKSLRGGLWRLLQDFWGDKKVKAWQEAIIGANGRFDTERVTNMISLNSLVYTYWDQSLCALRPVWVADDQLRKLTDSVRIDRNPYGTESETKDTYQKSPGLNLKVFDYQTEQVIESGTIFTVITTDRVEQPLPSKELLELLWMLKRVAAMRGAAEDEEDDVERDEGSPAVPSRSHSQSPVKLPLICGVLRICPHHNIEVDRLPL
ncbi:hypothetical protein N7493_003684 [Penicillium malachiteum]|uniref:HNH nuclease domain-containing protein n=1 Tax=Penicillium malachiteum TaxID=1324776 RepID=A0AAD6HR48_9EURO|nr:hypothetical protein N7493_003684 [Penicillium malachiteum]